MTSRECFENKWLYMKYIEKYLSGEILLAREWMLVNKSSKKWHEDIKINSNNSTIKGEHFMKIC
jgi:hypothetical protein